MTEMAYRIRAVLFDFDGTLTQPGALDFAAIRKTIGCDSQTPILEYIESLPDARQRKLALKKLDEFETAGAAASRPLAGAAELVHWLKGRGLPVGVITRNSRASVLRALQNFETLDAGDFSVIVTRDDPIPPKPSGDGVVYAARRMQVDVHEVLMVGDFLFDTRAGRTAGALTALLDPSGHPRLSEEVCDFRIRKLEDLRAIVQAGLPLPAGKLPNDILQVYLSEFHFEDPSVLINPAVGEDIAAVSVEGSEVLILKSDPITFATDAIGHYSVLVNANDIATSGAAARWFLTTLLLPVGTTASMIRQIMRDLADVSARWGISLCGGHTEITEAVRRPVVIGMMAGTIRRADVIDKKQMRGGDWVLMTKAVAVEGTAIIAREFEARLKLHGLTADEIAAGRGFLDYISILAEARLAARDHLATAMHDVTEGGLATALEELSAAGGHRIRVEMERIPVFDETRKFCAALGLNPLGLIGSGSLLICCREQNGNRLIERLRSEDIRVTRIGRVAEPGAGIEAFEGGQPVDWPRFAADEITKLF